MLSGKKDASEELTRRITRSEVEPSSLTSELGIEERKESMLEVNMTELTELVRECNYLEGQIVKAARDPCQMFYAISMAKLLFTREPGSRSASNDSRLYEAYNKYHNWLKVHVKLLYHKKKIT